jgi:hypothetical protein
VLFFILIRLIRLQDGGIIAKIGPKFVSRQFRVVSYRTTEGQPKIPLPKSKSRRTNAKIQKNVSIALSSDMMLRECSLFSPRFPSFCGSHIHDTSSTSLQPDSDLILSPREEHYDVHVSDRPAILSPLGRPPASCILVTLVRESRESSWSRSRSRRERERQLSSIPPVN